MIPDLQVRFDINSKLEYFSNEPLNWYEPFDKTWEGVLVVRSPFFYARMHANFTNQVSAGHVASCLIASLKTVPECDAVTLDCIYDEVAAYLKQPIDRQISPEIGFTYEKVSEYSYASSGGLAVYDIKSNKMLGKSKVTADVMQSFDNVGNPRVSLRVTVGTQGYVSTKHMPTPVDFNEMDKQVIIEDLFIELYKGMPELSDCWSHAQQALNTQLFTDGFKPWTEAPAYGLGKKDERVDQLPGKGNMVKHPVDGRQYELFTAIISLNDTYRWTRERIADWLETLDIDLSFGV